MNHKTLIVLLLITFNLQLASIFAQQTTIDSLKQVIAIAEQDTTKANTLIEISDEYIKLNLDTALSFANKALELSKKLSFNNGLTKAYYNIGLAHFYKRDYSLVINSWENQLRIDELGEDMERIAKCCNNIGVVCKQIGDYPKSIIYYNKAIEIAEKLGKQKEVSEYYNHIGVAYRFMGDYLKSIIYYNKSLQIAEEIDDKYGICRCYNNLGNIYNGQGNNEKSVDFFNKSLQIAEEIDEKKIISGCYANMGTIFRNQGSYSKAISYFNKSLLVAEEIEHNKIIAVNYNNIGITYSIQGQYTEAIEYFNKALKINEELKDINAISRNFSNIGLAYSDQTNYSKAKYYYNKSLKIKEEIGDLYGISTSYINFAGLHLSLASLAESKQEQKAELDTAIMYSNKSLKITQENEIRSFYEFEFLARSYWGLGQTKDALNNFNNLINLDNEDILMNFSFISEKEKENYFATIDEHYSQYNSFALEYKNINPSIVETVYNNTVKNKGLLLKSNTAMRNAVHDSNDTLLISKYDDWILLKKQIAKKYSNGEDITEIEQKANDLEGYIVNNSQEFSDFKKVQNISWKDIQAGLKEKEVAIEFLHFPLLIPDSSLSDFTDQTQYVALLVKKESEYPEMIPLFEEKQLESIIGKFGDNNYSYINSIYGKNTEVNKELYKLIWQAMEEKLEDAKTVYISPSGLLHKISFAAIAKEQNIYLCDNYNIELKSSTGKLALPVGSLFNNDVTCSLYGGINYTSDSTDTEIWKYLEGTKTEVQKIERILTKKKLSVNFAIAQFASEEMFKEQASNSNIIHIATHGFFYPDPLKSKEIAKDEDVEYGDLVFRGGSRGFGVSSFVENNNPLMRSGLVFAGANDVWNKQEAGTTEDGVLTAQEVAHIDMRKTNLVVMSACETGLGDIKGSEGVYGLQRAFKMAGVDYIIMSLWQVPDKETEEFMTRFYKKLIKQKDIKKAFAETQKEMRTKYDPYFWAAFVLIE